MVLLPPVVLEVLPGDTCGIPRPLPLRSAMQQTAVGGLTSLGWQSSRVCFSYTQKNPTLSPEPLSSCLSHCIRPPYLEVTGNDITSFFLWHFQWVDNAKWYSWGQTLRDAALNGIRHLGRVLLDQMQKIHRLSTWFSTLPNQIPLQNTQAGHAAIAPLCCLSPRI